VSPLDHWADPPLSVALEEDRPGAPDKVLGVPRPVAVPFSGALCVHKDESLIT